MNLLQNNYYLGLSRNSNCFQNNQLSTCNLSKVTFKRKLMNKERNSIKFICKSQENYDDYSNCIQLLQTKRKLVDRTYESMVKYWLFWTYNCFEKADSNDQFLNCQQHTTESLTNFLYNSINQLQI
ncbi:unnamed protein product [Paramecium octaurelia]|uniref:Uncharacterized protein n=1 Tax=Paramecium octaurelia TaxID=43137 RepID=A0A8S1WYZ8_PAROT|nr:unnamed protein product [Paramecium octaurelia]